MEATQHVTTTIAPSDVRADLDPSFVTPEHSENEYDDLLARAKGPEIAQVSAHQQHDFTAQQFSRFYQYIESHPEAIPGPVLAAIGEALILDLANEASIRGRGQLDMFIKDNPQVFLFINTYIDPLYSLREPA